MRARFIAPLFALILAALGSNAFGVHAADGPTFQLENSTIEVGQRPKVRFNRPLPEVSGERYWITYTPQGKGDPEWGEWQYVDNGTRELALKPTTTGGIFEVRLHDGYPRVKYNVVHRQTMSVVGDTIQTSSSVSAATGHAIANTTGVLRGNRVFWRGTTGDVDDAFAPRNWKMPDIVGVEAVGRGDELVVTLTFADDVNKVLHQKTPRGMMKAYMLSEFFFDTDGNELTGSPLSMDTQRKKGYDVRLQISTGLELEADGSSTTAFGNLESTPGVHRVVGVHTTFHIDDRTGNALPEGHTTWHEDKVIKIQGKRLIVRIPLERLALERGNTVRMCFVDYTMDWVADGKVSADAHLSLK